MKELISIVVPCFEEMGNLQKGVLDKIVHFLERRKYKYEVIVVDDGSRDGSLDFLDKFVAENTHVRLIKNKHLGKAGAVTAGVLRAKGEYILFTDMDQATPIEEMDKLLPFFHQRYDVVIGSRNNQRKGAPVIRLFISRSAIFLRKALVGLRDISDTQCGFKMFRREAAQTIFNKLYDLHNGFHEIFESAVTADFDVELMLLARNNGYKIREVPIVWLYVETRRVNPVQDSIEGVLGLFTIRRNMMKGAYG